MTSSIRLYEPLSDVISAFVLNAGHPKLALSLQALALHLGVHLARPPGVHQFIFTFGLKEVATDGPIPFLGLPFDATRGDRRDVRRVARIIEKHLGRWYDATLLRDVFASFFDADCQTTWRSDIAAHSSTSARVTLTLNSSSAIGELFVDRAEPHLLFRANPAPRCWLALLGSLKVAARSVCVRSASGGLIATAAGPVWMGQGKVARRFVVSLAKEPPAITQRWELTRRRLRGPLPTVLSE